MTTLSETAAFELAVAGDRTRHSLALYYRALCGEICSLVPYDDGSSLWEHADTETTVWLPRTAPTDDHAEFTPDEWYQVAMTHRAMHRAMGTFELDLDAEEPLFRRLRPADTGPVEVPSLVRLAALFGHSELGVHIFATCEDLRIDAAADRLLPGLAKPSKGVRHGALHERPQPTTLAPRHAAIEALVRLSLGGSLVVAARELIEPIARIVAVGRLLKDPRATPVSSAEAALRICSVLMDLPTKNPHRTVREVRFAELDADPEAFDVTDLADRMQDAEGFAGWYHPVAYRDWPGPRYVGEPASDMQLMDLLPQVAQRSTAQAHSTDSDDEDTEDAGNGAPPEADPHGSGSSDLAADTRPARPFIGTGDGALPPTTPLESREANEFVYPEWDTYAEAYQPAYTRVRVMAAETSTSDHGHYRSLARYGHLVGRLVRALERVSPDGVTTNRRTTSGDDLDLDAAIEAMIDLRTGVEPSDRVFTDLHQRKRDVAVAFAIDQSASTAITLPPDPETPGTMRNILDLQRDAVSLVAQALDRVGDAYGIYGFSGSGRDDARLSVVKDVAEQHTRAVWQRLGGLKPDHTTRMGPAIRHLTQRLQATDAATRILLVVSDGRPFDIDYGQQYGEEAMLGYAVGDTAKALAEAKEAGLHPYLVTIDPDGGDYLGTVCAPGSYHVIADAKELPEALAALYVSVRADATHHKPHRPARVPAEELV